MPITLNRRQSLSLDSKYCPQWRRVDVLPLIDEYVLNKVFARKDKAKEIGNKLLADLLLDPLVLSATQVAYMMATVQRECGADLAPKEEIGSDAYLAKYEPQNPIGQKLGNTTAGDGKRYRGRGFVQITGRGNYARMGRLLNIGLSLVDEPEAALGYDLAYEIMVMGMLTGTFTGVPLARYVSNHNKDYVNARRVVNGLDHAKEIANNAVFWEELLTKYN